MSSQNIKKANEYVRELKSKMSDYRKFSKEKVHPLFRNDKKDRKPPKDFVDSSFLYIRSYDGDLGIRPFSGITFWRSPDITVAPINDLSAYTRELDAGKSYRFNCNVRNRGDLIVPSAKVEFFLCTPTLGFDTRFATKLGVTSGWVNPYATTQMGINYTIPSDLSGHRCLFARTFSFSPVDLPVDDFQLSPPLDRHVGQLNLNIIAQSSSFIFNLVHLPNAKDKIDLLPMEVEEVFAMRHPLLADFKIAKIKPAQLRKAQMHMTEGKQSKTKKAIAKRKDSIFFSSKNKRGVSLETQKKILGKVAALLKRKEKVPISHKESRKVFRALRKMNKRIEQQEFELKIPNLGLAAGEAAAMNIRAINRVSGEIKGGITLIVTG